MLPQGCIGLTFALLQAEAITTGHPDSDDALHDDLSQLRARGLVGECGTHPGHYIVTPKGLAHLSPQRKA